MRQKLFSFPIHPLFFAAYPVLTLFATNLIELNLDAYVRPLLVSLAAAIFLVAIAFGITRDLRKSALAASLVLGLFFSYGPIYHALRGFPGIGYQLARHRFLGPIFSIALIAGLWLILRRLKGGKQATMVLNLVGLTLILFPAWQIGGSSVHAIRREPEAGFVFPGVEHLQWSQDQPLPDIYYIILDMHTRADFMRSDYDYDETPFINGLKDLGFYFADCSVPNYDYTQAALVSSLNYNYIPNLSKEYGALGSDGHAPWILIRKNLITQQLKEIGYKIVAFQTTYAWSTLDDADIFLDVDKGSLETQAVSPFESMLIKNTAVLILADYQSKQIQAQLRDINFPFAAHISTERYVLAQLPKIADLREPTFTFAHILIPHAPFVFRPDGSIQTDPAFYSGYGGYGADREHDKEGYRDQAQFIDDQILKITKTILAHSKTAPIILIQGDHGFRGENRVRILNAYYLNPKGKAALYPTISPVNSFRVVLNTYFGTNYPLLPDHTYGQEDWQHPISDSVPVCPAR